MTDVEKEVREALVFVGEELDRRAADHLSEATRTDNPRHHEKVAVSLTVLSELALTIAETINH